MYIFFFFKQKIYLFKIGDKLYVYINDDHNEEKNKKIILKTENLTLYRRFETKFFKNSIS